VSYKAELGTASGSVC